MNNEELSTTQVCENPSTPPEEEKQTSKAKKILSITSTVVTWVLVAVAVLMMVMVILSANTVGNREKSLFGYQMYIVNSDSMKDTFKAGDLIFVKEVDPDDLEEGDIITFIWTGSEEGGIKQGDVVTHKIKTIQRYVSGNIRGFITYGTTTGVTDKALGSATQDLVTAPNLVNGIYTGKISGLGNVFSFLRSTWGYITCILLPLLILIALQVVNIVKLYKNYKAEQVAEAEAIHAIEQAEVQAKLDEAEKLKQELEALKAQLHLNENASHDAPPEE